MNSTTFPDVSMAVDLSGKSETPEKASDIGLENAAYPTDVTMSWSQNATSILIKSDNSFTTKGHYSIIVTTYCMYINSRRVRDAPKGGLVTAVIRFRNKERNVRLPS